MNAKDLYRHACELAGVRPGSGHGPEQTEAETLIGLFQTFRPDGRGVETLFADLPGGSELLDRLGELYAAAGDDRRPQGGRDAYFVVRTPPAIDPSEVEAAAACWLEGLRRFAESVGAEPVVRSLSSPPNVRVLEGLPPKHPRDDSQKATLLRVMQSDAPAMVERVRPQSEHAALLRQAYYFISCDAMLRDYLMWPFYEPHVRCPDPFAAYFELWRHGVKFRVFRDDQVDFYIPRPVQVEVA